MSPLEKLDTVLQVFVDLYKLDRPLSFEDITAGIQQKVPNQILQSELPFILENLSNDGYIEIRQPRHKQEGITYHLKYKGTIFNAQKGYIGEQEEGNRLFRIERRQSLLSVATFWLTLVLSLSAVAAAVYYLTELYWEYHWFH